MTREVLTMPSGMSQELLASIPKQSTTFSKAQPGQTCAPLPDSKSLSELGCGEPNTANVSRTTTTPDPSDRPQLSGPPPDTLLPPESLQQQTGADGECACQERPGLGCVFSSVNDV